MKTLIKTSKLTQKERANLCRKSEFFFSFPWEDDEKVLTRFEKESFTTFEGLSNTLSNYWINFGVTHLMRFQCYPPGLVTFALIQYDEHSPKLLALNSGASHERDKMMRRQAEVREILSQTVKAFEESKHLQKMRVNRLESDHDVLKELAS
jgi:hypothetical protein